LNLIQIKKIKTRFIVMNIIKLSAINSTNDYLKELTSKHYVENFTIVVAESQTAGRGQMGSRWDVEPGKNLTFSILVKDLLIGAAGIYHLNVAVAISIVEALEECSIASIKIKWPNDILAGNMKVGGILIENSFKADGKITSVIGIGLNVNQQNFDGLPKASSLAVASGREYDKDDIMMSVTSKLRHNIAKVLHNDAKTLWDSYHIKLYKLGIPMPFENEHGRFMGIIKGVTPTGQLKVLLEDDTVAQYAIKEVQLLY
jgi:BirA family biotin operon repressor/biotin-[acetyl-CoA-carboxylase] ligase